MRNYIPLLLVTVAALAQDAPELIHTALTGSIKASGLDDPQYLLSFVPIQRLMLESTRHPLTKAEIDTGVQGTPVTLDHLLRAELLSKEGETYRLNYLLLTKEDQETMYRACREFGLSLADAVRAHKTEFDRIFANYPNASLRPQLAFTLIAGAALNWGGLDLTTELGYRVKPPHHADGSVYFVHSAENGAHLDFSGLYLDSETVPGTKVSFSTFGDGNSRLQGLPDVLEGPLENGMEPWKKLPEVYGALESEFVSLLMLAIDDAGQVMAAVANGTDTDAALASRKAMVGLLEAIGYLTEVNHHYLVSVPILTERDKPLVDATLKLSREIMTGWLRSNYPQMQDQLSGLSPMRSGVPFSLVFSEVWHYDFGFATKSLAESGFYANPRAYGNRYEGYVPLVWASSVLKTPGR